MAVELITGQGSTDHINSEDVGAYQARTFGPGCYVLHGCECSVVDANTIRVSAGELQLEGRHVRVRGSQDVHIQSGAPGRNRNDLIVFRYTCDRDGNEDAPLVALPGTPTEGEPTDPPHVVGSILDEDVAADIPFLRIEVRDLAVSAPVMLMDRAKPYFGHKHGAGDVSSGVLPLARGGTGAADAANARKNLGITPGNIGAAASSHSHTPASIGAAASSHSHTPASIGAAAASHNHAPGNISGMGDYVVAQGKSGNWNYVKLANGIAWCEGTWAHQYDAPRAWGSIFYNAWEKGAYAYPFKFVGVPTAWLDIESPNGSMWFGKMTTGTDSLSPKAYILAGVSQGQINVRLNVRAMGRWK